MEELTLDAVHQKIAEIQRKQSIKPIVQYLKGHKDAFPESFLTRVTGKPDSDNPDIWHFTFSCNATYGNNVLQETKNILKLVFKGSAEVSAIHQEGGRAYITLTGAPAQMNADIFARDREHYPQQAHARELRQQLYKASQIVSR
jgi:hypothetical protein